MDKVENNKTEELNEQAQVPKWLIVVTCLAVAILIALGVFLVSNYTATIPTDQSAIHGYYGTFGDYIGGIMNPLMTFITVFLLLYTVNQNHKMISISSKELKQSNIELEQTRKAIWNQAKSADLKINIDLIENVTLLFEKVMATQLMVIDSNSVTTIKEQVELSVTGLGARSEQNSLIKEFILLDKSKDQLEMRTILRLSRMFTHSVSKIIEINPDLALLYKGHLIYQTLDVLVDNIDTESNSIRGIEHAIFSHHSNLYSVLYPYSEEKEKELSKFFKQIMNKKSRDTTTTHQPQS